jgi:hypothetical protein
MKPAALDNGSLTNDHWSGTPEECAYRKMTEMSIQDLYSEYPTDAEIEEMWARYKSCGREGILAFLRKRTLEWQQAERGAESRRPGVTEASDHESSSDQNGLQDNADPHRLHAGRI